MTWHPQIAPYMIIATDSNSTKSRIQWLDVRDGSIQRSWELPIKISGIGPGEGIPEDLTGKAHSTRAVGDEPRVMMIVPLKD